MDGPTRAANASVRPALVPRRPRAGFTLLEIMLATVILVIGLLGLLALFPVAMKLGKLTIEETNGVLIAQSVEQAIRDGMQNNKGQRDNGRNSYFVFQHDGVMDEAPTLGTLDNTSPDMDYFILLPDPDDGTKGEIDRVLAYQTGKVFVYPETDGKSWRPMLAGEIPEDAREMSDDDSGRTPNGGGSITLADDDKDDFVGEDGEIRPLVMRTYNLTNRFSVPDPDEDEDEEDVDPISQYSFAFTVRPAYLDASLGRSYPTDATVDPAGELYEFEIFVYRSFAYNKELENEQEPIYSRTILVHR